ncbi:hypothetical protein CH063_03597 [Colletotrichum higginsianum]|uniref:Uncharacterized protein n=1 Tax=Colletotrichum higginsianum (strain IMI 349063) TaxID=759273 RepID=H1VYW4_COLHI|nr:hypothetical protein CH063_03597 [Colletotrichum higginsianum]
MGDAEKRHDDIAKVLSVLVLRDAVWKIHDLRAAGPSSEVESLANSQEGEVMVEFCRVNGLSFESRLHLLA